MALTNNVWKMLNFIRYSTSNLGRLRFNGVIGKNMLFRQCSRVVLEKRDFFSFDSLQHAAVSCGLHKQLLTDSLDTIVRFVRDEAISLYDHGIPTQDTFVYRIQEVLADARIKAYFCGLAVTLFSSIVNASGSNAKQIVVATEEFYLGQLLHDLVRCYSGEEKKFDNALLLMGDYCLVQAVKKICNAGKPCLVGWYGEALEAFAGESLEYSIFPYRKNFNTALWRRAVSKKYCHLLGTSFCSVALMSDNYASSEMQREAYCLGSYIALVAQAFQEWEQCRSLSIVEIMKRYSLSLLAAIYQENEPSGISSTEALNLTGQYLRSFESDAQRTLLRFHDSKERRVLQNILKSFCLKS